MAFFPCAHASHGQWQQALSQVVAQLRAQMAMQSGQAWPALGLMYLTTPYAPHAADILAAVAKELPEVSHWSGMAAPAILAGDMRYAGEQGALAVMLPLLGTADFRQFSGLQPIARVAAEGFEVHSVLVHGDGRMPELEELLLELASHTASGEMMGGFGADRRTALQLAWSRHLPVAHDTGLVAGGLSGVAFSDQVHTISRVVQGCKPIAQPMEITDTRDHVILGLNGRPALDVLMETLDVQLEVDAQAAISRVRHTLLALSLGAYTPHGSSIDVRSRVRPIVGLDPLRRGIVLDETVDKGMHVAFCERSSAAAWSELRRACAEIQEELSPDMPWPQAGVPAPARMVRGAIYVRSHLRGGTAACNEADAELQLIRHALGPIPLVGFVTAGEISGREVHGMSGQLTVFTQPLM